MFFEFLIVLCQIIWSFFVDIVVVIEFYIKSLYIKKTFA